MNKSVVTSTRKNLEYGEMIWTAILIAICLIGAYAYYRQLKEGLVVTNMRDYVSWGIYISNFVFFVAISLVVLLLLLYSDWQMFIGVRRLPGSPRSLLFQPLFLPLSLL